MAWQLAAYALHCLLGASALHTDYATEALQSIWEPEDDGPLIQSPAALWEMQPNDGSSHQKVLAQVGEGNGDFVRNDAAGGADGDEATGENLEIVFTKPSDDKEAGIIRQGWLEKLEKLENAGENPVLDVPVRSLEGKPVTRQLKCSKKYHEDKKFHTWACEDPCTFDISLGRQPGSIHAIPAKEQENYWCNVDSVLYRTEECEDKDLRFRGGDVVTAAVKTCETLGYVRQSLYDDAKFPCTSSIHVSARVVGLYSDNGMTFYMKYGFLPVRNGETVTHMRDIYCDAASKARKVTVKQAIDCRGDNNEFLKEVNEASDGAWGESEECTGENLLANCYKALHKRSLEARAEAKRLQEEAKRLQEEGKEEQVYDDMGVGLCANGGVEATTVATQIEDDDGACRTLCTRRSYCTGYVFEPSTKTCKTYTSYITGGTGSEDYTCYSKKDPELANSRGCMAIEGALSLMAANKARAGNCGDLMEEHSITARRTSSMVRFTNGVTVEHKTKQKKLGKLVPYTVPVKVLPEGQHLYCAISIPEVSERLEVLKRSVDISGRCQYDDMCKQEDVRTYGDRKPVMITPVCGKEGVCCLAKNTKVQQSTHCCSKLASSGKCRDPQ